MLCVCVCVLTMILGLGFFFFTLKVVNVILGLPASSNNRICFLLYAKVLLWFS